MDLPRLPVRGRAVQPLITGLIHHRAGTPAIDRTWARALVVHHARDLGLQLLDILETDHGDDHTRQRVAQLAASTAAVALVTDGVRPDLADQLTRDLGLRHEHVPALERSRLR